MNKKIIILFVLAFGFLIQTNFAQTASVNVVSLNMYLRTDRGNGEWHWRPNVSFEFLGDFDYRTSKVKIDFQNAAGKSLFSYDCKISGQGYDSYKEVDNCGNDIERSLGTNYTGVAKFKISILKNGATTAEELYSGSIKIDKFLFNPTKLPQFNKNFYYYIKYDWRLSIASLGSWKDDYTPTQLYTLFWVKGDYNDQKVTAQLFYKGKMVAEDDYNKDMGYVVEEDRKLGFDRLSFEFQATFDKPESPSYEGWWKLYANPGEYEVKLVRNGQVSRTFKFEIGTNGKIVDNGIAKKNKLSEKGMVFIPEVLGDTDGVIDRSMFADGWWGNPIVK